MSKRTLLAILSTLYVMGADYNLYDNSLYLMGGFTFNSAKTYLENSSNIGIRLNQNALSHNFIGFDAYQISFDYTNENRYINGPTTSIFRASGNLLWYFSSSCSLTPFILAGGGFEYHSTSIKDSSSSLFLNGGGGFEYQIRSDLSFVTEAKVIYKGDNKNSLLTNIGIKYSFGN
ncbi:MAG: hypothetical protein GXO02_04045 [Epsilonproteobacteria bacterium]|nr:hypothetical protein [Campylobacterota bacterium]